MSVAATGRGAGAEATLRTVLGYVDAEIMEAACIHVYVARDTVDGDGLVTDPTVREALAEVVPRVAAHLGR